jgi:hypothetical protein
VGRGLKSIHGEIATKIYEFFDCVAKPRQELSAPVKKRVDFSGTHSVQ